jgi:hypothetical protein
MSNDKEMTKSKIARGKDDYNPFINGGEAPVVREEAVGKLVYDLEERTARLGESIIDFAKIISAGTTDEQNHQSACGSRDERGSKLCRSR